jgi:hypothetical protein
METLIIWMYVCKLLGPPAAGKKVPLLVCFPSRNNITLRGENIKLEKNVQLVYVINKTRKG